MPMKLAELWDPSTPLLQVLLRLKALAGKDGPTSRVTAGNLGD